ncbi:unnamed protein product, partial [Mesorhabditis belari]|uniref:ShKT domain-containing protein n=1 Tax=Mesorhabditis belari TaxID=2138241 RepID=A0AAF3FQU8_9BILA
MVKLFLVFISLLLEVTIATDTCPSLYPDGCSTSPDDGAGNCGDPNDCFHTDSQGFIGLCFCSNCDTTAATCPAPTTTPETTTGPTTATTTTGTTASTSTAAVTTTTKAATTTTPKATTAPCGDTNTNCATWVSNGFCTNTGYTLAQRQQYCGTSCGLCATTKATTKTVTTAKVTTKAATTATSCVDSSTSCATWVANGFCTNTAYTQAQIKSYCGKSCKMC